VSEQPPAQETVEEARARRAARTEAKNQAVRDSLEPLAPGERPGAVTVAAIVAGLMALGNLAAFLFSDAAAKAEIGRTFQTLLGCGILTVAAIGMWRAKYWGVLGFQTILGLQILILSLSLLTVSNVLVAVLFLAIIVLSAVLFWYLVRAMARIQMPEAPDFQSLKEQREEAEAAAAANAAQKEDSDG
jgi:hypothetical protein